MVSVFITQAQERPMHGQNMPPPPQRPMTKEQRARLESFRIQFITKKLDLTPTEAEKFWPLYNEQKEATRNLMQAKKDDEIEFHEAMLVIRKKFKKDLMPILKTEERVNLALKVDRDLLNKMRNEMTRRKRPM
jgi:uncharacterized protein (DUF4415 family)